MEFIDLARSRYSCRKYNLKPVDQPTLEYILEAGRIAPSATNAQPWMFIVVTDEPYHSLMFDVYTKPWFKDAPVYIVLCADHRNSWKRSDKKDHADIDIAIAADHMTLAAAEKKLGTCWICNFDPAKCSEVLNLPAHLEPAVILSLGHPLDEYDPGRHDAGRKPMNEIVRWNKFH